jgi:hypothetical protein
VIEQADRNKAEGEGICGAPEPEILMQDIKRAKHDDQQGSFHRFV